MDKIHGTARGSVSVTERWSRMRRWLIASAIVASGLIAAWSAGRLQGLAPLREEQKLTQAAQTSLKEAQQSRDAERNKVALLEARRRLHLADMEIERRNFGTANDHLTAAARLLSKVPDLGPEQSAFVQQLKRTSLVASENAADAHSKVMALSKVFDQVVPLAAP